MNTENDVDLDSDPSEDEVYAHLDHGPTPDGGYRYRLRPQPGDARGEATVRYSTDGGEGYQVKVPPPEPRVGKPCARKKVRKARPPKRFGRAK